MRSGAFPFPGSAQRCALHRNTSAIQATTDPDGHVRLGAITHLPQGALPEICGPGFNDETLKVIWEGTYYFVFREDLDFQPATSAAYAGAF